VTAYSESSDLRFPVTVEKSAYHHQSHTEIAGGNPAYHHQSHTETTGDIRLLPTSIRHLSSQTQFALFLLAFSKMNREPKSIGRKVLGFALIVVLLPIILPLAIVGLVLHALNKMIVYLLVWVGGFRRGKMYSTFHRTALSGRSTWKPKSCQR
jgi:hypothetical protein